MFQVDSAGIRKEFRWLCWSTRFFINCIYWTFNIQNDYKMLQTWSRFLTRTQNTSVPALLKLVGYFIKIKYKHQRTRLCHCWNTTELTYKAYNLHNKYYFSIQISYIANMEILWNICICTEWERYDTRAQSSISQWLLCLMFCTECYWSYSKDKVFCSRKWGGVNVKVSSCMCFWGSSVISLTGHTRWTDNICTFNYEQAS